MIETNESLHESYKDLMARHRQNEIDKQKAAIAKLSKLAPEYIKNGYTVIHIHYSGCGDSGEVNEVYASTNSDDNKIHSFNYKDNEYEEMSEIAYDILTYDWYNNEGGGGSITIDLFHKEVEVDGHYIVEEQAPATDQESHFKF
tara:strand:+ start:2906 stop:3337 length:432 start_codon:yes stop_codon:yes gene_type:complete